MQWSTFWASAHTLNFGSWEFEEESPAKDFPSWPTSENHHLAALLLPNPPRENCNHCPTSSCPPPATVSPNLLLSNLVPTLVLVLEEPCQADEIWTRMLDSRVLGIDGDAGTDFGLKEERSQRSFSLPIFGNYLGDSISGTCKKLELFFAWTEGE